MNKNDLSFISKARKAVLPMFESIVEKQQSGFKDILDSINSTTEKIINSNKSELEKSLIKIVEKIKFPDNQTVSGKVSIDFPEVQTVKIKDYHPPVIKVEKTQVKFPDVQKVDDQNLSKQIEKIQDALVRLSVLLSNLKNENTTVSNLPVEQYLDDKGNKKNVLPVQITNWQHMSSPGGSSSREEKVWLREEYTYSTIAGESVPTIVEKWDDHNKLTEVYEYDISANPVVKSRRLEPHNGIGV